MTTKEIFEFFTGVGMTDEGACGLMGNMMAESGMKANIAQRGMTSLSDEEYTAAADNGGIDFAQDAVGYGLCQWTFHTRKAKLLAYAKSCGMSVGDPVMQVRFCVRELQSEYPTLFLKLCTWHELYDCSDFVCDEYEQPAISNYAERRRFTNQFYSKFRGSGALAEQHAAIQQQAAASADTPRFWDWKIALIQFCMQHDGYWGQPDGLKGSEFFAALKQYVKDMEAC